MREIRFGGYDYESYALCYGVLTLVVDGKHVYGVCCLTSGGYAFCDDYDGDHIGHGPWTVNFESCFTLEDPSRTNDYEFLPEDWFSPEEKELITRLVNRNIPQGCCGGCI